MWDGLDDAEKLLSVSHIRQSHLAVSSTTFQLVTICHRFISLFSETLFQLVPILTRSQCILTICEYTTYIYYREIPFLLFVVPHCADLTFLK